MEKLNIIIALLVCISMLCASVETIIYGINSMLSQFCMSVGCIWISGVCYSLMGISLITILYSIIGIIQSLIFRLRLDKTIG